MMRTLFFRTVVLATLTTRFAEAQAINSIRPVGGGTITGIVFDSLSGSPLAGAEVQLVAADNPSLLGRSATSDFLGRYTLADVPPARYALGFLHPMLDSLGVDVPPREVIVASGQKLEVDIGLPSPSRLRTAICGPASPTDSVGVLIGFARDARDGTPAAGAVVTGEWLEFTLGRRGIVRTMPRRSAKAADNGWFALCNVPNGGTVALLATHGADSTGRIEVVISQRGFAHRELFLGEAKVAALPADTPKPADSARIGPRKVYIGNGRLSGVVTEAVGGRPIVNASVRIVEGPETRTNDRGEWTISGAPAGTRMIEARAIGFYPVSRQVDVVPGAVPVRLALSTMQAVLDTVRITAKGVINENLIDFEKRRRSSGSGRFLTGDEIRRHNFIETIDIFRLVSGLYVEGDSVWMRGAFDRCMPSIYVDGRFMSGVTASELGDWVRPKDIAGVEVYPDVPPPQFQQALGGCGAIVVWRR